MRFFRIVFLPFVLLISGCTDAVQQNQPVIYYDVVGFIKRQIISLSAQKPVVKKAIAINQERNQQTTKDINWGRELELFVQADINKPSLRNSYQITRPDSLTYQYTLKKSEERLTVRSLIVRLDALTHQPRQIEAVLQTSNPLYSSERQLLLESGPVAGRAWQVRHYKVAGFQKLPYFSRNDFSIEGNIQ